MSIVVVVIIMDAKEKKKLGQYFTKKKLWIKPQIMEFIKKSKCTIAYDPYAGNGDLLKICNEYGINETKGLDIDSNLKWETNDSLKQIPHINNAIIVTNPPYLTKYSASRNHIKVDNQYFEKHTDLYQLAIDKMLEAQEYVVAIVPETYINSRYFEDNLSRIYSVTILTENPFDDTENPVCVVCFDNIKKQPPEVKVYIDGEYLNDYSYFKELRLTPKNDYSIRFNIQNGKIALRAVDLTSNDKKIKFYEKIDLNYNISKIGNSSRLITIIDLDCSDADIKELVRECNRLLEDYREKTKDITLSPFKGNTKDGKRRRRLDYKTARCIIEIAVANLKGDTYA
jgi:hypothetical protein